LQNSSEHPWDKFYASGVPSSIDYPKHPLQSFLSEIAGKHPKRTAIAFEGKKLTYREVDDLSNQFANSLISLGISRGTKIAIILPNLPQFVFCFYGALKAEAVVVPCNPLYREKELEFQLQDSEVEVVVILNNIVSPNDFFAEFAKSRPNLQKIKHVFTTSIADFLPGIKKQLAGLANVKTVKREGTIDLVSFISKNSASEPTLVQPVDPIEDLAVLQYTGGTTGISKGAMLTHFNLICNAIAADAWAGKPPNPRRILAVTPFFHIYGLTECLNSVVYGGHEMVILPSFRVKEVLETIQKEKITDFPGVPTMYTAIINHPEVGKYSLRSVERCVSGAAPLPLEVQKRFGEITGGLLVEGYGLTEASPVTHCNPVGQGAIVKSGSVGIPFPDTDAKIVDQETGKKDLAIGDVGELAVKGPQVMKGYWKRADETSMVLSKGWLLTGDIARMDQDGYFYIVDRKKDMIDSSGFKVYPREVEEILYTHPDIKEAAVVGVKDSYRGETVKAFVVLKDRNKNPGADAITEYCKDRIAPYKAPRIVEFKDALPKSLVGKVLRRKLREDSGEASPAPSTTSQSGP
jgi:long-chain acyl-CoA synthetase